MSVVKTKCKVFVKLGHLAEAKGVYVCVSGGYCWKSIVGSRQQFLKHLSTNSVFLSCLLDPTNSAPKSSSGKYLPMVGFRWQRQSVFWRISGGGEQMLWSRVGHELDLEQDGAGTGGTGSSCWAVNTTPSSLATGTVPSCSSPHSCADVDTLKATVTRDVLLTVLAMRSSAERAPALHPSLFLLSYAGTWDPSWKYSGLVWMEEGASDVLKKMTSASSDWRSL